MGKPMHSCKVSNSQKEIFQIPFRDKFIVYAPLKNIAFLANQNLVNLLARMDNAKYVGTRPRKENQAMRFIRKTGILEAEPEMIFEVPREYLPVNAVLFMGNQCNLKCEYCYAKSNEWKPVKMSVSLALQAVDIACSNAERRGLDQFEVSFHGGGEPTLNWETLKTSVKYAKKKILKSSVNASTNGMLNQEKRQFVLDYFDGLSLSFDGPPDIQNRQRPRVSGQASFLVVMKTIEALDKKSFPYGIRMTVTKDSAKDLARMITFVCEETRAMAIQVEPAFPQGRGKDHVLTKEAALIFIDQFTQAREIASARNRNFFYSGARLSNPFNRFCQAPCEALIVLPAGEISACFEIFSTEHPQAKDFILGKIEGGQIWLNKDLWQKIVSRTGDKLDYCGDCFSRWHCAGDCLSKTFNQQKADNFKPSWRCHFNREISKLLLLEKIAKFDGVWLGQKEVECAS